MNGVWLRGWRIYNGTDDYNKYLTDFGKRRPEHQSIHTIKNFQWVRSYLDNHATYQGTCLGVGGMKAALRRMREIIVAGDAPK